MNQPQYYTTQSLSLATAIQALSPAKLEDIELSPTDQRATFYFDRTRDTQLDQLIASFWARQLPIDSFTYFETLKYLKSRLYEAKHAR